MKAICKKLNLLSRSTSLALALNLLVVPFSVANALEIMTPEAIIPNFSELTDSQKTAAMMRVEVADMLKAMPLTTERLKQAAQYFNANEDNKARAVLDISAIIQEQATLLAQLPQNPAVQTKLDDLALELIVLARLTDIHYSSGQERIAKAGSYFEQALKSGRTPERLYEYVRFLNYSKQYNKADEVLTESILLQRNQLNSQPERLARLAESLDQLGSIKQENKKKLEEALNLHTEALKIARQLISQNPMYLSLLSVTLSSLSTLAANHSEFSNKVADLYKETINELRSLANTQPDHYLPVLANTLNSLGLLTMQTSTPNQNEQLEQNYTESLAIYRKLAEKNPITYKHNVLMLLNNLGSLLVNSTNRRDDVEKLFNEALVLGRELASTHPDRYLRSVYQEDVIRTLQGLGQAYIKWNEPLKARAYLQEALDNTEALSSKSPEFYSVQIKNIKETLASIK